MAGARGEACCWGPQPEPRTLKAEAVCPGAEPAWSHHVQGMDTALSNPTVRLPSESRVSGSSASSYQR